MASIIHQASELPSTVEIMLPQRIVLSRKGFDSVAGGFASPIFDDGRMTSLPIPEPGAPAHANVSMRFDDLGSPVPPDWKIPSILGQLRPSFQTASKVHLDPDIRPFLRSRNVHDPVGYFGQVGKDMTELRDGGVCDPCNHSLFLFFGWFKGVRIGHDGRLGYERARAGEPRTHHQHVIWGWLQSDGEPRRVPTEGELAQELRCFDHHPHVEARNRGDNNYVFVGRRKLSFREDLPGAGVFAHYNPALRLTCPLERNKRSSWPLPAFLRSCARGRIENAKWSSEGCAERVQYRGFGQEFVFDTKNHESETAEWLGAVFQCAR